jgi:hypothetical protein
MIDNSIENLQTVLTACQTHAKYHGIRILAEQYIPEAIDDLKDAKERVKEAHVLAQHNRKSLAQEIAATLKKRGYWVPEDESSADLISAVGQALSPSPNIIKLRDLCEHAFAVVNAISQATKEDDVLALVEDCKKIEASYQALPSLNTLFHITTD